MKLTFVIKNQMTDQNKWHPVSGRYFVLFAISKYYYSLCRKWICCLKNLSNKDIMNTNLEWCTNYFLWPFEYWFVLTVFARLLLTAIDQKSLHFTSIWLDQTSHQTLHNCDVHFHLYIYGRLGMDLDTYYTIPRLCVFVASFPCLL